MQSRDAAVAAVLGSLYAVLVIALAPVSFGIVQVRVADALLPLSIVFGFPAVLGFTVGVLIANLFSPFGLQVLDVFGGALANFLATYYSWRIASALKSKLGVAVALAVQVVVITFIVGSYLVAIVPLEIQEALRSQIEEAAGVNLPLIVVSWLGVFGGSVVAIIIIGYPLLLAVNRFLRPKEK